MRNSFISKYGGFLGLILSIAVIAYVLFRLDWRNITSIVSEIRYGWLVLGFGIYAINYIFRTLRMRTLFGNYTISFKNTLAVMSLHGMYNYLLPAKTGEFSFVLLAKRFLDIPVVESTSMLITARFLDFLAIAFLLPVAVLIYWPILPSWLMASSLIFSGLFFLISAILISHLQKITSNNKQPTFKPPAFFHRVYKAVLGVRQELLRVVVQPNKLRLLFLTALIWLCVYSTFYFVILGLNYSANIFQIVIISVLMVPMTLLPFQGFANIGTHELGWVTAFMLFGMPEETALSIAIASHFVILVYVLFLGIGAFITTYFTSQSASAPKPEWGNPLGKK